MMMQSTSEVTPSKEIILSLRGDGMLWSMVFAVLLIPLQILCETTFEITVYRTHKTTLYYIPGTQVTRPALTWLISKTVFYLKKK